MRINNTKVDILESEIVGNLSQKTFRGESYYAPISIAVDLNGEKELKRGRITFEEIAELDKFINDMLLLRGTAIKARGYYDIRNNPLSPIEDYIHSVVNKDMWHVMHELEGFKKKSRG